LPEPATLQQLAGRDAYLDGLLGIGKFLAGPLEQRMPNRRG
jgi:hypothetical protein